jgi:hypothetical protein
MLSKKLVIRMCSHCLFPACWQLVNGLLTTCYTRFLSSIDLSQVVPTTCYCPAFNNSTTLLQLDEIYQHCYNLLTSLLQACCEHILLTSCEIFTCVNLIKKDVIFYWSVCCWYRLNDNLHGQPHTSITGCQCIPINLILLTFHMCWSQYQLIDLVFKPLHI